MCACHNLCGNLFALFWFVAAVVSQTRGGRGSGGVGESNSNNFVVYFGSKHTHRKFCQFAAKPLEFMADTDFGQGAKKVSPQPQEASSSGGREGKGALNATLN